MGNLASAMALYNDALNNIVTFAGEVNVYNIRKFNTVAQTNVSFPIEGYLNLVKPILGFNAYNPFLMNNPTVVASLANDFMGRDAI